CLMLPAAKAAILFTNYKTFVSDTLVILEGKNGAFKPQAILIPHTGFYWFQIGKYDIALFLEKGTDHLISLDYATYPANFKVNGRSLFQALAYQLNNDWLYAKEAAGPMEQLANINRFYEVHLVILKDAKGLTEREQNILHTLLNGIVSIMRNNLGIFNNLETLKNELAPHLKNYVGPNKQAYEVFPEKFVKSMLYNSFKYKFGAAPEADPSGYFDYINAIVPDKLFREYFSAQFFSNNIRTMDEKNADSILKILRGKITSDQLLNVVATQAKKVYRNNFMLPDIKLYNRKEKIISTRDFLGHLVLIDVWALWCGPCMAEKPNYDALEKHYKSNPTLKVLRVSVDQDRKEWLNAISKENYNDLWADGALRSAFSTALNIQSIPRFILINENGVVINSNAPRPSSKELYTLIDKELKRIGEKKK
ncbi:MAG: TlpA family protein disulfide reductase, partial [Pedobacter sp.]